MHKLRGGPSFVVRAAPRWGEMTQEQKRDWVRPLVAALRGRPPTQVNSGTVLRASEGQVQAGDDQVHIGDVNGGGQSSQLGDARGAGQESDGQ